MTEGGCLLLTPTHACLANLFSRLFKRKWPPGLHIWFVLGAALPDIPMIVVGCIEWLRYAAHHTPAQGWSWLRENALDLVYQNKTPLVADRIWAMVSQYGTAIWLNQCFHSVFFWIAVILVAGFSRRLRKNLVVLSCGAIFFHILVDWPTHAAKAHNYLWPIFHYQLPGLISYANPLLLKIEAVIGAIWLASRIFWIIRRIVWTKTP